MQSIDVAVHFFIVYFREKRWQKIKADANCKECQKLFKWMNVFKKK